MADRFLPADDPVLEEVLNWTVARDAQDIRRLLEWLPLARSSKERRALLARVHELLGEVELSLNGLDFITAISGAATSISNVGPGLGPIIGPNGNFSSLPDISKWILSLGMILGRLELFAILVLFLPSFWRN